MNYRETYNNLIQTRRNMNRQKGQGIYYEKHHILPKCLHGTDDEENLVLLTGREHFIAHKLLTKIYVGNIKIYRAYCGMFGNFQGRKLTGRQIAQCKDVSKNILNGFGFNQQGVYQNNKINNLSNEQKQEIVDIFKGTLLEKEVIADMYDVHWSTIMKILKEQGLTGKEIKSIACVKREYRHKLQLLANGAKRKGNNKGIQRNKVALEKQRESITQYWKKVKEGKIKRVEKFSFARPTIIVETGEVMKSKNILRKDYFVQNVSHKLISRKDPNIVYHWKYVNE